MHKLCEMLGLEFEMCYGVVFVLCFMTYLVGSCEHYVYIETFLKNCGEKKY